MRQEARRNTLFGDGLRLRRAHHARSRLAGLRRNRGRLGRLRPGHGLGAAAVAADRWSRACRSARRISRCSITLVGTSSRTGSRAASTPSARCTDAPSCLTPRWRASSAAAAPAEDASVESASVGRPPASAALRRRSTSRADASVASRWPVFGCCARVRAATRASHCLACREARTPNASTMTSMAHGMSTNHRLNGVSTAATATTTASAISDTTMIRRRRAASRRMRLILTTCCTAIPESRDCVCCIAAPSPSWPRTSEKRVPVFSSTRCNDDENLSSRCSMTRFMLSTVRLGSQPTMAIPSMATSAIPLTDS